MTTTPRWVALAFGLALTACQTAPPPREAAPPRQEVAPSPQEVLPPVYRLPREDFPEPEDTGPVADLYPGSGDFIDLGAARRPEPAPPEEGDIVLNFEGQPLPEVVKALLGDVLGENYVIAPGVAGEVTFSTAKPIASNQALPILELLLAQNGASLVYMDGRYHVVPTNQAIPGRLTPRLGPLRNQRGYEVLAVPLQYISPTEMEKLLKPFARENAIVYLDNARNLMILAGTQQELRNYLDTIEIFDVNWLEGMSVGIFPLTRVEAETVVAELQAVFGEEGGSPLAGMFRFVPIERLNAVMIITPQEDFLSEAQEWVERLDRGGSDPGTRLYVYDVKHVDAVDLADTLNNVFGSSASRSSARRESLGATAPGLQPVELEAPNQPGLRERERRQRIADEPSVVDVDPVGTVDEAVIGPGGGLLLVDTEDVRITGVEETNSLLIRATPRQYEAVLGAVEQLDVIPLQVLIEALILEVSLNDSLNYGVQWFFENGVTNAPGLPIEPAPEINSNLSISVGPGGFDFINIAGDLAAIVNALETASEVRTISAPSLLVLNNREANINVGTQIPVNTTFFDGVGGGDVTRTSVQFRDTGVTLDVVPRVNPGGMVFLEIAQEVSDPGAQIGENVAINRRSLATQAAVQSGETVVLGGLIEDDNTRSSSGVPWLAKIPFIGGLFGSQTQSSNRTELVVLLTPTVVGTIEEARRVSEEYRNKLIGLEPFNLEQVRIQGVREQRREERQQRREQFDD